MATFLKYFLFLIVISTILINVVSPPMHKQIVIVEPNTIQIIKTVQSIENKPQTATVTKAAIKNNIPNTPSAETQTKNTQTTNKRKEIRTDVFTNYPASSDNIQTKTNKNTQTNVKKNSVTKTNTSTSIVKSNNTNNSQNIQAKKSTPKTQPASVQTKPKQQTENSNEEIVAWNQWNANIRNKLLSDLAKMRNNHSIILSSGSTYSYRFTVSKSRVISNISVRTSVNSVENAKVVSAMESLIRGYSGSYVLTFPSGSQKEYYNVSSSIAISGNIKQDSSAKASDFSVYEKVKK